jgi:pantoate--beta-alanine ligase
MELIRTAEALQIWRKAQNDKNGSVGFVPTMGALHQGHLSLVAQSAQHHDQTLVSIFVNPLQFNNAKDLAHYPRTQDADISLLEKTGCTAIYLPEEKDIYGQTVPLSFDLGPLEQWLEGAHRPGHFQGVANVIEQLFSQVQPDAAYFGLKDYQQYLIIRHLSAQRFPHIRIVGCPTLRDAQGLAMSSRNTRLSPEAYRQALVVPKLLLTIPSGHTHQPFSAFTEQLQQTIRQNPLLRLEYFSLNRADNLQPLQHFDPNLPMVVSVAFYADDVRLIDNILF